MEQYLRDEACCGIPSFIYTSYENEATDNGLKDDLPGEECYFNAEEYIDNSWLVKEAATAVFDLHDFNNFLKICEPFAELDNVDKVNQSTANVAARELEDVLPDQIARSITPPQMQSDSFRENIITTGNKKEVVDKWYCVFCFNNARFSHEKRGIVIEPKDGGPWRTHVCKDSKGVVICPVLAAHVCRICGATGKFAHTEKYCDLQQKRQNRVKNLNPVD